MARTYDLVSLKEEGKVLATMDFEVRDSTLFMCLRWPDSRRGTEIYELARDSYRLVATRAYAGEMPDDMKMFYQTAKSLKYARVFYYDETKNLSSTGTLSIFVKMQSQFPRIQLAFLG